MSDLLDISSITDGRLRIHAPAEVRGCWDSFRIEQAIANLLTNAGRYGPGKPVEARVWEDRENACFSFTDQGIGIAKEDQERIFERAVSPDHVRGLGLGLYITRDVVRTHGGAIRVESDPFFSRCGRPPESLQNRI